MAAWYEGPCRITVIGIDSDFPQRATVKVEYGGTIELAGRIGETVTVETDFRLTLEHQRDGRWSANVRDLHSRWQDNGDVRSQVVRSKDVDWPWDTLERNIVVQVDRIRATTPAAAPKSAPSSAPGRGDRPSTESVGAPTPVRTTGGAGLPTTSAVRAVARTASQPAVPAQPVQPARRASSPSERGHATP
ncbi:hypothetical protein [Streptacidiphilus fuscans]|uniref:Uncharacterized protein n=1 Tax=Streptacidiphilus fuscans TaxID=2789292 RepID=A0A931B7L8_9ACTN|nr:hypothetical protein [Streptacidiphilus fuscans]MBF9072599.1 hypothetical protein [Streptacidiphilus fuscans]